MLSNLLLRVEILFLSLFTGCVMDVPIACQYPAYPSGCEAYATAAVLRYNGVSVREDVYISDYLPKISVYSKRISLLSKPFDSYFVGDPSGVEELGLYANPPVMVKSANKYLKDKGITGIKAFDTTGTSFKALIGKYILRGIPVVIWLTLNDTETIKKREVLGLKYVSVSHTVVLAGYNAWTDRVYIADSIGCKRWLSYKKAKRIYNKRGKLSFIIKEMR